MVRHTGKAFGPVIQVIVVLSRLEVTHNVVPLLKEHFTQHLLSLLIIAQFFNKLQIQIQIHSFKSVPPNNMLFFLFYK